MSPSAAFFGAIRNSRFYKLRFNGGDGNERAGGKVPPTPPNQDMVFVVVILGTKNRQFFVSTILRFGNESLLSFPNL